MPFAAGFVFGGALGFVSVLWLGSLSDAGAISPKPLAPSAEAVVRKAEVPDIPDGVSRQGERRPVGIAAVGDIQLARRVGQRIAEAGWASVFERVRPLLEGADIAFCNLESPASTLGLPYKGKDPTVTFRANPGALFGLKRAGFDMVSIANNHANDYGAAALAETLDSLDALGIACSGAGASAAAARKPAVIEVAGSKVALLSYAEPMWSVEEADGKAGVALIREPDIIADIASARRRADFVIVSLHWGTEHEGIPREGDRALARRLVDNGAAAILGHHPHVLQGIEFHNGAPIIYSMGNFVFDMISARTYESAITFFLLGDDSPASVQLVPIRIDGESFAPDRAKGKEAAAIGKIIAERCAALGTKTKILPDGSVLAYQ